MTREPSRDWEPNWLEWTFGWLLLANMLAVILVAWVIKRLFYR